MIATNLKKWMSSVSGVMNTTTYTTVKLTNHGNRKEMIT